MREVDFRETYIPPNMYARQCLYNLQELDCRPLSELPIADEHTLDYPLIGMEIEVKWSSFFPALAKQFFNEGRRYEDLDHDAVKLLGIATTKVEGAVYEKLNAGLTAGLSRGRDRDRWWEHVFPPTGEPEVAIEMIKAMNAAGLLPPGQHALHLTVGNVKPTSDFYFALLAMELLGADRKRIRGGFHLSSNTASTGWAKKGRAGIFIKRDWNLKHEAEAIELRTLFLDNTGNNFATLIKLAYNVCRSVCHIQNGTNTVGNHAFKRFKTAAQSQLSAYRLPDCNWEKPHVQPDIWKNFANVLEPMRNALQDELQELILN